MKYTFDRVKSLFEAVNRIGITANNDLVLDIGTSLFTIDAGLNRIPIHEHFDPHCRGITFFNEARVISCRTDYVDDTNWVIELRLDGHIIMGIDQDSDQKEAFFNEKILLHFSQKDCPFFQFGWYCGHELMISGYKGYRIDDFQCDQFLVSATFQMGDSVASHWLHVNMRGPIGRESEFAKDRITKGMNEAINTWFGIN